MSRPHFDLMLLLASLVACQGKDAGPTDDTDVDGDTDGHTDVVDTTPPHVTATVPTSGATAVDPDAALSVTFDEALDSSTVSSATVHLSDDVGEVTLGVSTADGVVTLAPSGRLRTRTAHTATVDVAVRDVAGNPLAAPYAWTFTTGPVTDTLLPTVEYTPRDSDGDHVPDVYVSGGPPVRILMAKKGGTLEDRAILEFPLAGVTSADAVSATLSLSIDNADPGGAQSYLAVYGFAADGAASMDDWSGGVSLGSVYLADSASPPTTLDVTAAVNAALTARATHVGIRLESDGVDRANISTSDQATGIDRPTITVTF